MTCFVFQVPQNRQDEPLTGWRGRAVWGRLEEEQGEEVKKCKKRQRSVRLVSPLLLYLCYISPN